MAPKTFWREAILIAWIFISRMSSSILGGSILGGSIPSKFFLNSYLFSIIQKMFGCVYFVHKLWPGRDKLDAKSLKWIFLDHILKKATNTTILNSAKDLLVVETQPSILYLSSLHKASNIRKINLKPSKNVYSYSLFLSTRWAILGTSIWNHPKTYIHIPCFSWRGKRSYSKSFCGKQIHEGLHQAKF